MLARRAARLSYDGLGRALLVLVLLAGCDRVDIAASLGVWTTPMQHAADVATTKLSVGFAAGIDSPGTNAFNTAQFDDALVQTSRCN